MWCLHAITDKLVRETMTYRWSPWDRERDAWGIQRRGKPGVPTSGRGWSWGNPGTSGLTDRLRTCWRWRRRWRRWGEWRRKRSTGIRRWRPLLGIETTTYWRHFRLIRITLTWESESCNFFWSNRISVCYLEVCIHVSSIFLECITSPPVKSSEMSSVK